MPVSVARRQRSGRRKGSAKGPNAGQRPAGKNARRKDPRVGQARRQRSGLRVQAATGRRNGRVLASVLARRQTPWEVLVQGGRRTSPARAVTPVSVSAAASAAAARGSFGGGGRSFSGGGRGGGGRRSDINLKHDIALLGWMPNGLGFYRLKLFNGEHRALCRGHRRRKFTSVMPSAVIRDRDGYLRVLYEKLGLRFQTS